VSIGHDDGTGDGFRASGTSRFRRRGTVTALRLSSPRRWSTEAGDLLEVQAGDWWVTDDAGVSRGVADADFRASYRPLDGSRYERVGAVTARRAETRVVVQTQEGSAIAEPGTWVVTDDEGNSWPVPPAVFEAGYEPADAT
jgi:hypothetical protein